MSTLPRITFGIIVLNGEPFVRYNLRSLYAFAHQVIVVEGAVEAAAGIAVRNGHSRDGTLATLRHLKTREDPEGKIQIVTKNGFWREKKTMSEAYARRATGDCLWQVHIHEFYHPAHIKAASQMLAQDATITAVSFEQIGFVSPGASLASSMGPIAGVDPRWPCSWGVTDVAHRRRLAGTTPLYRRRLVRLHAPARPGRHEASWAGSHFSSVQDPCLPRALGPIAPGFLLGGNP